MARAEAIEDKVQRSEPTGAKARDYLPLLGPIVAAVLGFSLMCGASMIGLNDLNRSTPLSTGPVGFVDFAISNMNTAVVQTVQAISGLGAAPTSTDTATLTPTSTASKTPTKYVFPTFSFQRRTSTPSATPTRTPTLVPTLTHTLVPTSTNTSTPTNTPTFTPTNTLTPSPTDTFTPPPTDTPIPTDTPMPTDTPIPTDTPMPIILPSEAPSFP